MQFLNHYSFLLLAGASIFGLLIYTTQRGLTKQDLMAFGALLIGFSLALWIFQPIQPDNPSIDTINLANPDKPVLVQFHSPYCLACMSAKPLVTSFLARTDGTLEFLPININDPSSQTLVQQYGVQYTPTFILLDTSGLERYRSVGTIEIDTVLDSLNAADLDS